MIDETLEYNKIYIGDVYRVLDTLPKQSVDCVITSPPYWGKRNYGTVKWFDGNKECNHEAARVKSRFDYSMGDLQRGYSPTDAKLYKDVCPECGAYKTDFQLGSEPHYNDYLDKMINLVSKLKDVLKDTGSMWINIGDTYSTSPISLVGGGKGLSIPQKTQVGIPFRLATRIIDELGLCLRNTVIWHKPNCFPSSVSDRFTDDFEYFFFFVKDPHNYYFEQQKEPSVSINDKRYNQGKIKYDGKMKTLEDMGNKEVQQSFSVIPEMRNKRSVWTIATAGSEGRKTGLHVAPYPEKLIETPMLSSVPIGGVVLDPFMGSGTTGSVAKRLGRNFLGIELNEDYADAAMNRINNTQPGMF